MTRITSHDTWRRGTAAMALAVLCIAAALLATGGGATAAAEACNGGKCVVLIEVNGLTPQDVTPDNTPFMWALAHPDEPDQAGPGANGPNTVLQAGGSKRRAGWIWQAPRSVMSASNAAATASLLTGSNPEHTGVPADAFLDPRDGWVASWGVDRR